jgi:GntR family galactonate operon transcriptional repressor
LIEPAAAEFAARRGEPGRIAVVAEALDSMRRSVDDKGAFHEADAAFHRALYAASGNSLIDRLSTIVGALLVASFRRQGEVLPSMEAAFLRHDAVLQAITAGDSEGA